MKPWSRLVGVLGLLLLAGGTVYWLQPDPDRARPASTSDFAEEPSLLAALAAYERRGGHYLWGSNDCSVFVSDYLRFERVPIRHRLTTAVLAGTDLARHGLTLTTRPRVGTVINYRYYSVRQRGMAGHCGVLFRRQGQDWVAHNSAYGGLVVQPLRGFLRTAERLGVAHERVRFISSRATNQSSSTR